MPILVDHTSRVICFGMDQEQGHFQIQQSVAYGTQVVALVEPRSKGRKILGLPVFATAREAERQTSGNVALIMSHPEKAADAIVEANEAGIGLIICLTEDVPVHDLIEALRIMKKNGKSRLIGPGSCGVISPEQARCGFMPGYIWTKGPVGIVSSEDSLVYTVAAALSSSGIGQSTFVGIGRGLVVGTSYVDVLELFENDPYTEMTLLLGLPQRGMEQDLREWLCHKKRKPLVVLLAGQTVLKGKILAECKESVVEAKQLINTLKNAGVCIADTLTGLPDMVQKILGNSKNRITGHMKDGWRANLQD